MRGPRKKLLIAFASFIGAVIAAWIAQATADLAVVALGIKRFQLRHGRLPASLHELVPEFLAQCPLDGMNGQPLRYCAESDSTFLLYSIGIEGKDDLGHGSHSTRGNLSFQ